MINRIIMISKKLVCVIFAALPLMVASGTAGATVIVETGDQFLGQPAGINVQFVTAATLGANSWTGSVDTFGSPSDRTDNLRITLAPSLVFTAGSITNLGPRILSLSGSSAGATFGIISATTLAAWTLQGFTTLSFFDFTLGSGPTSYNISLTVASASAVPEPAILTLMALGLAGIGFSRRKAT